jgi:hypothetical protein
MSLRQGQTFESELQEALRNAGLSPDPRQVIGRFYRFGCEHGSHHQILFGTIQAVQVSDEGGLDLYVSNPRFWGMKLMSLKHSNGKWMAYVDIDVPQRTEEDFEGLSEEEADRLIEKDIDSKFFAGEFHLLA